MREIERKFLVHQLPESLDDYHRRIIAQGYLVLEENGLEIRLRRANGDHCLTIKRKEGLDREEYNIPLTKEQWDELWPLTAGRRLEKVRHDIPSGKLTVELDVFRGRNEGVIVAEVEFASLDEAHAFTPLPWFGQEVTGEAKYSNRHLAVE